MILEYIINQKSYRKGFSGCSSFERHPLKDGLYSRSFCSFRKLHEVSLTCSGCSQQIRGGNNFCFSDCMLLTFLLCPIEYQAPSASLSSTLTWSKKREDSFLTGWSYENSGLMSTTGYQQGTR